MSACDGNGMMFNGYVAPFRLYLTFLIMTGVVVRPCAILTKKSQEMFRSFRVVFLPSSLFLKPPTTLADDYSIGSVVPWYNALW
jgi:hypothetical protein